MKPAQKSHNTRTLKTALVCVLLFFLWLQINNQIAQARVSDRFNVEDVNLTIRNDIVESISSFDMSLSYLSIKAINQGVPVKIVLRYATPKKWLWFTSYKEILRTEYKVSRQAISSSYLLKNLTTLNHRQFQTLDDALREISSIQVTQFKSKHLSNNSIAVRIHLDLFDLPSQIRAKAFFSDKWKHNSGWSIWSVPQ